MGGSRFGTSRRGARHPHPLSIPQATAWGSDEQILTGDESGKNSTHKDGGGGIVVAQEVRIQSESIAPTDSRDTHNPVANDWGFSASASRHDRTLQP